MHIDNFEKTFHVPLAQRKQDRGLPTSEVGRAKIISAVRQHGAGNNKRLRLDNSG